MELRQNESRAGGGQGFEGRAGRVRATRQRRTRGHNTRSEKERGRVGYQCGSWKGRVKDGALWGAGTDGRVGRRAVGKGDKGARREQRMAGWREGGARGAAPLNRAAGHNWAGVAHLLAGISGGGQVQHRGGHSPIWPAAPPAAATATSRGGPPSAARRCGTGGLWVAGHSWAGVAHLLAGISGGGQAQHRGGHSPIWPAAPPAAAAATSRGGPRRRRGGAARVCWAAGHNWTGVAHLLAGISGGGQVQHRGGHSPVWPAAPPASAAATSRGAQLGRCRTLACWHQWGWASAAQGWAQPGLACCTTGSGGGDEPRGPPAATRRCGTGVLGSGAQLGRCRTPACWHQWRWASAAQGWAQPGLACRTTGRGGGEAVRHGCVGQRGTTGQVSHTCLLASVGVGKCSTGVGTARSGLLHHRQRRRRRAAWPAGGDEAVRHGCVGQRGTTGQVSHTCLLASVGVGKCSTGVGTARSGLLHHRQRRRRGGAARVGWAAGHNWAGVAHLLAGISGGGQVQHRGGHSPTWPAAPPAAATATSRCGPPSAARRCGTGVLGSGAQLGRCRTPACWHQWGWASAAQGWAQPGLACCTTGRGGGEAVRHGWVVGSGAQLGRCRTPACWHQWGWASAAQGWAQPDLACCTTGSGGGDEPWRPAAAARRCGTGGLGSGAQLDWCRTPACWHQWGWASAAQGWAQPGLACCTTGSGGGDEPRGPPAATRRCGTGVLGSGAQLGRCRTPACWHQWGWASAAQGWAQPGLACCTTGIGGGDEPRGTAGQVSHTCLLASVGVGKCSTGVGTARSGLLHHRQRRRSGAARVCGRRPHCNVPHLAAWPRLLLPLPCHLPSLWVSSTSAACHITHSY